MQESNGNMGNDTSELCNDALPTVSNVDNLEVSGGNSTTILLIAVLVILNFFIFFGNGLTLVAYLQNSSLRQVPFNIFIVSLAGVDVLVGIFSVSTSIFVHLLFIIPTIKVPSPVLYSLKWLSNIPILMSLSVVLLMTYDRLRMVRDPIVHQTRTTTKGNVKQSIYVCIASVVYVAFGWICTYFIIAGFTFHCEYQTLYTYGVTLVFVNFVLPFSAIASLNTIFVIQVNRRMLKFPRAGYLGNRPASSKNNVKERELENACESKTIVDGHRGVEDIKIRLQTTSKVAREDYRRKKIRKISFNLLLLVSVCLICWIPQNLLICASTAFYVPVPNILYDVSGFFVYFNSAINPVIYAVINKKFRSAMAKVVCPKFCP